MYVPKIPLPAKPPFSILKFFRRITGSHLLFPDVKNEDATPVFCFNYLPWPDPPAADDSLLTERNRKDSMVYLVGLEKLLNHRCNMRIRALL